jgi:hypothetical protein
MLSSKHDKEALASALGRDSNMTLDVPSLSTYLYAPSLSTYLELARLLDLSLPETRRLMRAVRHVHVVAAHGASGYQSAAEVARGSPPARSYLPPSVVAVSSVLRPLSASPQIAPLRVVIILDSSTLQTIRPAPPSSCLITCTARRSRHL